MHKKNIWVFSSFILVTLCVMLLTPIGGAVTTVFAINWPGGEFSVDPVQLHPDPATQTITVTYHITNVMYDGDWYVQVNRDKDADNTPPINPSLKKNLNSERHGNEITGSWTISLYQLFGANNPIPVDEYTFRFYGPCPFNNKDEFMGMLGVYTIEQNILNIRVTFQVIGNNDVKLSCPQSVAPLDKITVSWQNASKNNFAWIGFYAKNDPNEKPQKKVFINQGNLSGNQLTIDANYSTGDYQFRIFQDQGYTINGKKDIEIKYKTPNLTVTPEQGRPGETLVISWTNGPNYIGYGDSNRVDLYQGDKLYTNLQTGIWPEGTINYKIRNNMPQGMYQVRMISGTDESLMGYTYLGVQAAQPSSSAGTGNATSSSTSSTGTSTTTQTTSTGSSSTSSTSSGASTASTSATTIVLNGGQSTMTVSGVSREIVPGQDAESMTINGRLYAPIQPIAEAMGGKVAWDSREKKMTITVAVCDNAVQGLTSSDEASKNASTPTNQNLIIGLWKVTQGTEENHHIYMYQEGGKIAGMWDDRTIITGSMNGNVFKGEYHGTVNPNGSAITMTLANDGLSFEGSYHHGTIDQAIRALKDVDATAKIKAAPTAGASDAGFDGTWGTTAGDIILTQDGGKVRGTWGDKTINGAVNGNVLNGRYYSTRYPELIWDFNMTMRTDGKTCILFHTKQGGVLINTWRK